MNSYFISSDIHSFFDEWQDALKKKGFDINNPEHILVLLGDIFDRGNKSLEVYNFLKSLPKERRILVRGNHEILLRQLVARGFAERHDYSNGTYDTLFQLMGYPSEEEFTHQMYRDQARRHIEYGTPEFENYRTFWRNARNKAFNNPIIKEILEWIASDEWIDYWETSNYIFVHSWIPLGYTLRKDTSGVLYRTNPQYREDWRNATKWEWEDATWGCPWQKALAKLNQTGKTIVCGHWHTSDFFNHLTKQKKDVYDCPIFKSKRYKLIGLDACTAGSHKVNCLVLNEEDV